jgi:hypothetical protein
MKNLIVIIIVVLQSSIASLQTKAQQPDTAIVNHYYNSIHTIPYTMANLPKFDKYLHYLKTKVLPTDTTTFFAILPQFLLIYLSIDDNNSGVFYPDCSLLYQTAKKNTLPYIELNKTNYQKTGKFLAQLNNNANYSLLRLYTSYLEIEKDKTTADTTQIIAYCCIAILADNQNINPILFKAQPVNIGNTFSNMSLVTPQSLAAEQKYQEQNKEYINFQNRQQHITDSLTQLYANNAMLIENKKYVLDLVTQTLKNYYTQQTREKLAIQLKPYLSNYPADALHILNSLPNPKITTQTIPKASPLPNKDSLKVFLVLILVSLFLYKLYANQSKISHFFSYCNVAP